MPTTTLTPPPPKTKPPPPTPTTTPPPQPPTTPQTQTQPPTQPPSQPKNQPTEQQLIHASQNGDLTAFDELIRRHHTRIYATIYHMTANREDTDDLTQETFLKAHKALKNFKGTSTFYTWTYRIAINKTLNFLKQRKRKNNHTMSLNQIDPTGQAAHQIHETITHHTPRKDIRLNELQTQLNQAMQKLTETHRLVVTLHDIQGIPHEQIAKIMNTNTGTIRSRLYYARQQLQAHLTPYLKN